MNHRHLAIGVMAALIALVGLEPVSLEGQEGKAQEQRTPLRTAWGEPDLQGVWSFATITPLERPSQLAGKDVLTEAEAAALEAESAKNRFDRPPRPGETGAYNRFWVDQYWSQKVVATRQTSLIVDPPDGRIPVLTPEGQKRMDAQTARVRRPAHGPEDRSVGERCILGFNSGPPMLPGGYNQNVQLFQAQGHIALLNEMVHDVRIIPLDGRAHLAPTLPQWKGNSRGRWERDTLIVETVNFSNVTSFRGSSPNMHLVERFKRLDPDTLLYEFTVEDPKTWVRPWTVRIPMTKAEGGIFEYACHEGNHGMVGILSGARADDRAAAASKRP